MRRAKNISQLRGMGRKRLQRGLAVLVCLLILTGAVPVLALSALNNGEAIVEVEEPEVASYTVETGTEQDAIGLPDELTITVRTPPTEEGGQSATREETAEVEWKGSYDKSKPGAYTLRASFVEKSLSFDPMPKVQVTVAESVALQQDTPQYAPEPAAPDAPQCACNAVADASGTVVHAVDCPLYTAPESAAPDAPQCACNAVADASGTVVHTVDCPLYTAPEEPVANGLGGVVTGSLTAASNPTQAAATTAIYYRGDTNKDGMFTSIDFSNVSQVANGTLTAPTDPLAFALYDIDANGTINSVDFAIVLKIVNGETIRTDFIAISRTASQTYALKSVSADGVSITSVPENVGGETRSADGSYVLKKTGEGEYWCYSKGLVADITRNTYVGFAYEAIETAASGALTVASSPAAAATTAIGYKGDLNGDGVFSAAEAQTILNVTMELQPTPTDPLTFALYDTNTNGIINANDATVVLGLANGIGVMTNFIATTDAEPDRYILQSVDIKPNGAAAAVSIATIPANVGDETTSADGEFALKKTGNGTYWCYSKELAADITKDTHVEFVYAEVKSTVPAFTAAALPQGAGTSAIYARGDIDKNGVFNAADVSLCAAIMNDFTPYPTDFIESLIVDLNLNGDVNSVDLTQCRLLVQGNVTVGFAAADTVADGYALTSVSVYLNGATAPTATITNLPANVNDSAVTGEYTVKKTAENTYVVYCDGGTEFGKATRVVFDHAEHKRAAPEVVATVSLTGGGSAQGYVAGDVNQDGQISRADYETILLSVITAQEPDSNSLEYLLYDANCSGDITASDYRSVLLYAVGTQSGLPYIATATVADGYTLTQVSASGGIQIANVPANIGDVATDASGKYFLKKVSATGYWFYTSLPSAEFGKQTTVEFAVRQDVGGPVITSAQLNVTKTLAAGAVLPTAEAFEFTLEFVPTLAGPAEGVTLPDAAGLRTATAAITSGSAAPVGFADIRFTTAGTYQFVIAETNTGIRGMGYAVPQTVYVKVTNDNGTLVSAIVKSATDDTPSSGALTFVNTYTRPTGALTVTKTVTNGGDPNALFAFRFIFGEAARYSYTKSDGTTGTIATGESMQLKHGQSVTISIHEGVTYTVVEDAYMSYVPTPSNRTYSGTITATPSTAAYSNRFDEAYIPPTPTLTGSLTVKNTVTGDLGDRQKDFAFTIIFNASGSYQYTGSKNGTIRSGDTVLLRHGQYITIVNLPAGTTYSVTESGNSGYRTYTSGDTGQIAANRVSTAAFTNSRSKVPGTGDDNAVIKGALLMLAAYTAAMALVLADIKMSRKRRRSKAVR